MGTIGIAAESSDCTWCGHNDIGVGGELCKLGLHGVPTHQNGCPEAGVAAQLCDHLVCLQGQLPGGCHDYCPCACLGRVLLQSAAATSNVGTVWVKAWPDCAAVSQHQELKGHRKAF